MASSFYERALSIDPFDISALIGLGAMYEKAQDRRNAKECYEKVHKFDHDNFLALSRLGWIESHSGNLDLAKDYWTKALLHGSEDIAMGDKLAEIYGKVLIEKDLKDPYAFYILGMVSIQRKNTLKAHVYFNKALELEKDYELAKKGLNLLEANTPQENRTKIILKEEK